MDDFAAHEPPFTDSRPPMAPEPRIEPWGNGFIPRDTLASIDPAEHAAHSLIDCLTTLEQQIAMAPDLARATFLRELMKRAWKHVTAVQDKAGAKCDEFVERLR